MGPAKTRGKPHVFKANYPDDNPKQEGDPHA